MNHFKTPEEAERALKKLFSIFIPKKEIVSSVDVELEPSDKENEYYVHLTFNINKDSSATISITQDTTSLTQVVNRPGNTTITIKQGN